MRQRGLDWIRKEYREVCWHKIERNAGRVERFAGMEREVRWQGAERRIGSDREVRWQR